MAQSQIYASVLFISIAASLYLPIKDYNHERHRKSVLVFSRLT